MTDLRKNKENINTPNKTIKQLAKKALTTPKTQHKQ